MRRTGWLTSKVHVTFILGVPLVLVAISFLGPSFTEARRDPFTPDESATRSAPKDVQSRRSAVSYASGAVEPLSIAEVTQPPPQFRLEIVAPDGMPASGAQVVIHRDGSIVASAIANEQGVAICEAHDGCADATVALCGYPAHTRHLDVLVGTTRIQLPPGTAICGRVAVNGGAPLEPITLTFGRVDAWHIPPSVSDGVDAACTTDPTGRFCLGGLPRGSLWRMRPLSTQRITAVTHQGQQVSVLAAPADDIEVAVTPAVMISGVVASAAGEPVGTSECQVEWRTGSDCLSSRVVITDSHGQFSFQAWDSPTRSHPTARIEIVATDRQGLSSSKVVLPTVPASDQNIGTIVIGEGRLVSFVVRDCEGTPIEGAVARVDKTLSPVRTDSSGIGLIRLNDRDDAFYVGELRFEVAQVDAPIGASEPIAVTLYPAATLRVRLLPSGALPPGLSVVVVAEGRAFTEYAPNDLLQLHSGASPIIRSELSADKVYVELRPNAGGCAVLAGLRPHYKVAVTALTSVGGAVADAHVITEAGHDTECDVILSQPPCRLTGMVTDARLLPVAGAVVSLHSAAASEVGDVIGSRHSLMAATDAQGQFSFRLLGDDLVVCVRAQGYVPCDRRITVHTDSHISMQLQRGRSVSITVRQDAVGAVEHLGVEAVLGSQARASATEVAPGNYVFDALPQDSELGVRFEWAERPWCYRLTPGSDATLVLPRLGRLSVACPVVRSPDVYLIRATSLADETAYLRILEGGGTSPCNMVEFPPMPPGDYALSITTPDEGYVRSMIIAINSGQLTHIASGPR